MYTAEKIKNIHRQLQELFSFRQILLGGSYLYGEASEASDLDFYVLDSFPWAIFFRRRHYSQLITALKNKYQAPSVHVLIVPTLFFRCGWYYVYGQNIKGEIIISKINKKIIFRTALKLAYLHYIDFLKNQKNTLRLKALRKAAQQLAAARMMLLNQASTQPIFSRKNLLDFTDKNPTNRILNELLSSTTAADSNTVSNWGRGVGELLTDTIAQGKSFLSFSIINYLLYNIRFLVKKPGQFMFTNPDAVILRELQKVASTTTVTEEHCKALKEIVFPALIF